MLLPRVEIYRNILVAVVESIYLNMLNIIIIVNVLATKLIKHILDVQLKNHSNCFNIPSNLIRFVGKLLKYTQFVTPDIPNENGC